jgi:hypothetical protein
MVGPWERCGVAGVAGGIMGSHGLLPAVLTTATRRFGRIRAAAMSSELGPSEVGPSVAQALQRPALGDEEAALQALGGLHTSMDNAQTLTAPPATWPDAFAHVTAREEAKKRKDLKKQDSRAKYGGKGQSAPPAAPGAKICGEHKNAFWLMMEVSCASDRCIPVTSFRQEASCILCTTWCGWHGGFRELKTWWVGRVGGGGCAGVLPGRAAGRPSAAIACL